MDQNDENQGKSFLINKDSCQTSILPQAFLKKSGVTIFPWMTWQQWLFPQVTPISCNFLCKSFFNSKKKLYIFYFSKLSLPILRKNNFCDWEKLLKFEAKARELAKILRLQKQFIRTIKVSTIFETNCFFNLFLEVSQKSNLIH